MMQMLFIRGENKPVVGCPEILKVWRISAPSRLKRLHKRSRRNQEFALWDKVWFCMLNAVTLKFFIGRPCRYCTSPSTCFFYIVSSFHFNSREWKILVWEWREKKYSRQPHQKQPFFSFLGLGQSPLHRIFSFSWTEWINCCCRCCKNLAHTHTHSNIT